LSFFHVHSKKDGIGNKIEPDARWLFNVIGILAPAIVFIIVWFSLITHYFVPSIEITEDVTDTARRVPIDSILDDIQRFFESNKIDDKTALITSAEKILKGQVTIPGVPVSTIGFPFDPDDLDKKLDGWPLFFARFSIPDLLLNACELTGRDDFLMAARDVILGFSSYERKIWLPKGLLWNDHAVAGRIPVLAKFWKLYRNHEKYNPVVAGELFQLVSRSAKLLSKPTHFTFATNHGIMQNLALWQICLAFPSLPDVEHYKKLAFDRMQDQMRFYINSEGVVLEHSAGYQEIGLELVGMAFRYLALLNMPIPEEWRIKYRKAEAFYALLLRPDGSLPMFGDTSIGRRDPKEINERLADKERIVHGHSQMLYPVAGYSIWWDGLNERSNKQKPSQTVVAWSHFPGHAHKHADEMSVLLWAGGYNWWTNVGYWPYGTKGRKDAVSWAGSNAPHIAGESPLGERNIKLLSYAFSDSMNMIDLERTGPDTYVARRQVIYLAPDLWAVIDHADGNEDSLNHIIWTTGSNVNLRKGELSGSYILEPEDGKIKLTTFVLGSKGADIRQYKGSFSPFAGWEIQKPASAILVEQPANDSWAVAIWSLQESDKKSHKFSDTPFMKHWKNPENWQIELPFTSGSMNIRRKNDQVFVENYAKGIGIRKELQMSEPPQITDKLTEIHTAYEKAARKYPLKKYSMNRHLKATYFIIILFLVQEAFLLVYRKYRWKSYQILRGMSVFCWIAVGAWLFTVYL